VEYRRILGVKSHRAKTVLLLKGGLGNQLFQFATGWSLASEHGSELILSTLLLPDRVDEFMGITRWPLEIRSLHPEDKIKRNLVQPRNKTSIYSKTITWLFSMSSYVNAANIPIKLVTDSNIAHYANWVKQSDILVLKGTFGNGTQFVKSRTEIRNLIHNSQLRANTNDLNKKLAEVAVHIRLGDHKRLNRTVMTDRSDFLRVSLKRLDSPQDRTFRIFSDEPENALSLMPEQLQKNCVFAPEGLTPLETLDLMSQHETIIGSPSSFSWWAAFLQSPGITYMPKSRELKLLTYNLSLSNIHYL
jgi:hypothetical protein